MRPAPKHSAFRAPVPKLIEDDPRGRREEFELIPEEPSQPAKVRKFCAQFAGFSLHGAVRIAACARARLERLARYVLGPPLAQARLSRSTSGLVVYKFRKPWRNGKQAVVMHPLTFISRLAALVPFPRQHLLTCHGILAPAASARHRIVPPSSAVQEERACCRGPQDQEQGPQTTAGPGPRHKRRGRRRYTPWAVLMRRVSLTDVLACECGGRRRVRSMVCNPVAIRRILVHLGLDPNPPSRAPPRGVSGVLGFD